MFKPARNRVMTFMSELLYANIETIILQFLTLYESPCSHTGIAGMGNLQFSLICGCAFPSLEECLMPLWRAVLCQIQHKVHSRVFVWDWEQMNPCCCQLQREQPVWSCSWPARLAPRHRGWSSSTAWELLLSSLCSAAKGIDSLQTGKRSSRHCKWAIAR